MSTSISSITTSALSYTLNQTLEQILYPELKPYNKEFLKVSNIHSIHYREYGNPKGIPIIDVHG